ncbi:hypothetical protein Bpfe_026279 [Biomphalaria pfeifferi]|uniref:Uncharacterized protein n=1 Tax=Biomphalaria pfeifferi TaxID=112525 RepID=A0AAD8AYM7_BIOPF|nr:hypothetical protein Bpfe_026279 [Biomphalaria pfeifferi]
MTLTSHVISQDRSRASILNSDPFQMGDLGVPPATSTIILYDCTATHRAKADNPGAFQVFHNGEWWSQLCQEGLIWNQTLCRCEYPHGRRPERECREYRALSTEPSGQYEQFVNGNWIRRDCSLAVAGLVWDQETCQCVWGPRSKEMITGQGVTPCDIMLNMTFEDGIKDSGKGSFVEIGRGPAVPIYNLDPQDAVDGSRAAFFSETALNVWYFAGNEMGTSLRVEFRFKMANDPSNRDKYQIFISNGCNVSNPGYTTPSLAIGYRPADQSYLLAFETSSARKAIVCTKRLGAYSWHTVSLIYEDGTLLLRVDDQPCIISQDFTGPIQKTPCPLTVGADPLERQSMYKGYFDNLLVARYCRRFIDSDPSEGEKKGPMPVETAPNVLLGGPEDKSYPDRNLPQSKSPNDLRRGLSETKHIQVVGQKMFDNSLENRNSGAGVGSLGQVTPLLSDAYKSLITSVVNPLSPNVSNGAPSILKPISDQNVQPYKNTMHSRNGGGGDDKLSQGTLLKSDLGLNINNRKKGPTKVTPSKFSPPEDADSSTDFKADEISPKDRPYHLTKPSLNDARTIGAKNKDAFSNALPAANKLDMSDRGVFSNEQNVNSKKFRDSNKRKDEESDTNNEVTFTEVDSQNLKGVSQVVDLSKGRLENSNRGVDYQKMTEAKRINQGQNNRQVSQGNISNLSDDQGEGQGPAFHKILDVTDDISDSQTEAAYHKVVASNDGNDNNNPTIQLSTPSIKNKGTNPSLFSHKNLHVPDEGSHQLNTHDTENPLDEIMPNLATVLREPQNNHETRRPKFKPQAFHQDDYDVPVQEFPKEKVEIVSESYSNSRKAANNNGQENQNFQHGFQPLFNKNYKSHDTVEQTSKTFRESNSDRRHFSKQHIDKGENRGDNRKGNKGAIESVVIQTNMMPKHKILSQNGNLGVSVESTSPRSQFDRNIHSPKSDSLGNVQANDFSNEDLTSTENISNLPTSHLEENQNANYNLKPQLKKQDSDQTIGDIKSQGENPSETNSKNKDYSDYITLLRPNNDKTEDDSETLRATELQRDRSNVKQKALVNGPKKLSDPYHRKESGSSRTSTQTPDYEDLKGSGQEKDTIKSETSSADADSDQQTIYHKFVPVVALNPAAPGQNVTRKNAWKPSGILVKGRPKGGKKRPAWYDKGASTAKAEVQGEDVGATSEEIDNLAYSGDPQQEKYDVINRDGEENEVRRLSPSGSNQLISAQRKSDGMLESASQTDHNDQGVYSNDKTSQRISVFTMQGNKARQNSQNEQSVRNEHDSQNNNNEQFIQKNANRKNHNIDGSRQYHRNAPNKLNNQNRPIDQSGQSNKNDHNGLYNNDQTGQFTKINLNGQHIQANLANLTTIDSMAKKKNYDLAITEERYDQKKQYIPNKETSTDTKIEPRKTVDDPEASSKSSNYYNHKYNISHYSHVALANKEEKQELDKSPKAQNEPSSIIKDKNNNPDRKSQQIPKSPAELPHMRYNVNAMRYRKLKNSGFEQTVSSNDDTDTSLKENSADFISSQREKDGIATQDYDFPENINHNQFEDLDLTKSLTKADTKRINKDKPDRTEEAHISSQPYHTTEIVHGNANTSPTAEGDANKQIDKPNNQQIFEAPKKWKSKFDSSKSEVSTEPSVLVKAGPPMSNSERHLALETNSDEEFSDFSDDSSSWLDAENRHLSPIHDKPANDEYANPVSPPVRHMVVDISKSLQED